MELKLIKIKRLAPRLLCIILLMAYLSFSGMAVNAKAPVNINPTQSHDINTSFCKEDRSFSFAWLTDTQYYTSKYPDLYKLTVQYILDNRESRNTKYVIHTGDIVDNSKKEYQWINADNCLSLLDNAKMPYGVLAGNHDVNHDKKDYSEYDRYFGEKRFCSNIWYGGSYKNNKGHYDLISAGRNDFIIVYMGWGISKAEFDWMNQVLAEHKDKTAILCFHNYLNNTGRRDFVGEEIFNNVVKRNKNVIMTLNGHYHGAARKEDKIDDDGDGVYDRTVYQILSDYQEGPMGGGGYIRYITFDTKANKVSISTYSPYFNDYNFFNNNESRRDSYGYQDEFTYPLPLKSQSLFGWQHRITDLIPGWHKSK
ncbi:YvnB [[Clostridium] cellulosi]|uniref:YvnB n=1 Tax=[Clostridium] cellulosi TaxID=29343 RepID=A0A078KR27_9FIRM|nr:MAG: hypothetical protein DIU81_02020 [[Clostridium] cellulosi]CDZ24853.1 YvnB [[Clostridium] cellulosi]